MNFKITENEGLKYSKISGDYNKIHIDEKTGYNSIFGEKICHGTLVITKIFKLINLEKIIKNQKKFNINIEFYKHLKYRSKILVVKKKNQFSELLPLKFTKHYRLSLSIKIQPIKHKTLGKYKNLSNKTLKPNQNIKRK